MKRIIAGLVFLLILLPAAQGQQVWRGVDERGEIRYADRPFDGAVPTQLSGSGHWLGKLVSVHSAVEFSDRKAEHKADQDVRVVITRPWPGETVWGEAGLLQVTVDVSGEDDDNRLVLELDGAETAWEGELPAVTLKKVWRGEHRLRARLVSPNGETLFFSKEVRFFKQQPSAIGTTVGVR